MNSIAGDRAPYALNFLAVVIASVLAGWRSGLIALVDRHSCSLGTSSSPSNGAFGSKTANSSAASSSRLPFAAAHSRRHRALSAGDRQGRCERDRRLTLLDDALKEIDHRTRNNYQTVLAMIELSLAGRRKGPSAKRSPGRGSHPGGRQCLPTTRQEERRHRFRPPRRSSLRLGPADRARTVARRDRRRMRSRGGHGERRHRDIHLDHRQRACDQRDQARLQRRRRRPRARRRPHRQLLRADRHATTDAAFRRPVGTARRASAPSWSKASRGSCGAKHEVVSTDRAPCTGWSSRACSEWLRATHPGRDRRLDLPAVARRLLPRQARAGEGAGICLARSSARSRSTRPSTAARSPKSWAAWEKVVPDGFQFAVKGSRFCVTRSKLAEGAEGIGNFFAQGSRRSGPSSARSCGCSTNAASSTATTSPASSTCFPRSWTACALRHAIEPRHESFRDDGFFELCRDADVAVVYDDDDEFPLHRRGHASFAYARLQRMSEDVADRL